MPQYGSVGGVNSLFPPISSVTNLTSAVVARFIDDTEAEVNARIAKRYTVPVTPTCPLLVALTERETIYRIVTQRALIQFPPAQQGRHTLQIQHDGDQKLLERIAEGEMILVASGGGKISPDTSQIQVFSSTQNYNPTFADGLPPEESVLDTDKSTDALADRVGRGQ